MADEPNKSVSTGASVSFMRKVPLRTREIFYYEKRFIIDLPSEKSDLAIGRVMLTKNGLELAPISGSEPIPEFVDYVRA